MGKKRRRPCKTSVDLELEMVILKKLSRVLKEKRLYYLMQMAISGWRAKNSPCCIYWALSPIRHECAKISDCSPFVGCVDLESVAFRLHGMDSPVSYPSSRDDAKSMQNYLMFKLNYCLHVMVEPWAKDQSQVEEIGREAFNMICLHFFDEGYKDYTEEAPHVSNKFIEALQPYLQSRLSRDNPFRVYSPQQIHNIIARQVCMPIGSDASIDDENPTLYF